MINNLKTALLTLKPWQASVVAGVFMVTLIGALTLLWIFRRWNARQAQQEIIHAQ